jgi:DNA polymerase III epsilon subunit-like protein
MLNDLLVYIISMILFGAGSSVPFEIPGMTGFTEQFIAKNKDMSEFIMNIKDAISKSEEMIGISLPFDLETLLSVLNDLSNMARALSKMDNSN